MEAVRTIAEIWPGAEEHGGDVPEQWVFEGMLYNDVYYFRLYKTPEGRFFYTRKPRPKERKRPRYDLREEDGRTYARQRWKRKPYESR